MPSFKSLPLPHFRRLQSTPRSRCSGSAPAPGPIDYKVVADVLIISLLGAESSISDLIAVTYFAVTGVTISFCSSSSRSEAVVLALAAGYIGRPATWREG